MFIFCACKWVCEPTTKHLNDTFTGPERVTFSQSKIWNDDINLRKNSLCASLLAFSRLSCCAAATCPTDFCTQSRCVATGVWGPSHEWRWTGSGGPPPTPGTRVRRRGRTPPGTACCSGWPRSPARGAHADWLTERNTATTATGDCYGVTHTHTHQADLVHLLPKQLTVDFRFCVRGLCCHFSNNTQHLWSVGAAGREHLPPQPWHRPLLPARNSVAKVPAFPFNVPQRNPARQHNHRQSNMSLAAVAMAAKGVTRSAAVICHWHLSVRSCRIKVCRETMTYGHPIHVTLSDYICLCNHVLYGKKWQG